MTEKRDIGPTIMAMKGDSLYRNKKVAFNLARFLKCPLIDAHDIHQAFQKSSSSPTNDNNITPALDAAYAVASTQLSLKLPVIINGPHPLPPGATIGNLWRPLAASSGARLVVVECHQPDDEVEQHQRGGDDDYDDDGISMFHVDAESFDMKKAEGFVSKLSRRQKRNTTTMTTTTTNNKEKEKRKQRRNDHLHEWVGKQPNSNTADLSCIACQDSRHDDAVQIIRTSYYQCADCDYALHKHCAEKFDDTLVTVFLRCPPYLRPNHPQQGYDFPSKVKCRNCRDDDEDVEEEEFSAAVDNCHDCLMQTNLRHKFLPTVLRNKDAHHHRLNLVIMPFGYNYKYLCGSCGGIGYSVGYKCYECIERPNYHVRCVLWHANHAYHLSSSFS